jgi:hypothetical protein
MLDRNASAPQTVSALSGHARRHPFDRAGATVQAWLRRAIPDAQSLTGKDIEEVVIVAGAAIGAPDVVVRRQER